MKKLLIALALVSAPLAAQDFEVGLLVAQNSYKSQTITMATVPPSSVEIKPDTKTVVAGRFGYAIVDLGPALFQLTAAYQPKVDTAVEFNGVDYGDKYGHQYWSVGAMFNFKAFFAFGAGVEYRSEKLTASGPTIGSEISTTYGRPWARANIGLSFPTPIVKPFVGVELAAPLTSQSVSDADYADSSKALKAHAPNFQVGIYGGIRF